MFQSTRLNSTRLASAKMSDTPTNNAIDQDDAKSSPAAVQTGLMTAASSRTSPPPQSHRTLKLHLLKSVRRLTVSSELSFAQLHKLIADTCQLQRRKFQIQYRRAKTQTQSVDHSQSTEADFNLLTIESDAQLQQAYSESEVDLSSSMTPRNNHSKSVDQSQPMPTLRLHIVKLSRSTASSAKTVDLTASTQQSAPVTDTSPSVTAMSSIQNQSHLRQSPSFSDYEPSIDQRASTASSAAAAAASTSTATDVNSATPIRALSDSIDQISHADMLAQICLNLESPLRDALRSVTAHSISDESTLHSQLQALSAAIKATVAACKTHAINRNQQQRNMPNVGHSSQNDTARSRSSSSFVGMRDRDRDRDRDREREAVHANANAYADEHNSIELDTDSRSHSPLTKQQAERESAQLALLQRQGFTNLILNAMLLRHHRGDLRETQRDLFRFYRRTATGSPRSLTRSTNSKSANISPHTHSQSDTHTDTDTEASTAVDNVKQSAVEAVTVQS